MMKQFYLHHQVKKAIKKRTREASKFLRKTSAIKNKKKPTLNSLPYYLLIGPTNSGKTTLLANSELKFILAKNFKSVENIKNTKDYNWWATKHAVIIDTPGINFSSTNNKPNFLQKYFLRLAKKYNNNTPPAGILLILDLDDLLRKPKKLKQNFFDNINKQLAIITKTFRAYVPIYLLFNKCDLITGFREYFNDSSREERQQIWGNLIKTRKVGRKSFADNFNGIFHKMILRLNDQLIWRLQHEHNYDRRALINEFPTKMMQLKKPLTQLLNKAFRKLGENFCPAGIFFVSAIQKRSSCFYQAEDVISSDSHSLINIQMPNNKAYFVHNLFNEQLFAEKIPVVKTNAPKYKSLKNFIVYPLLTILTCLIAYASWYKLNENTKLLGQVKQIIIDNQLTQDASSLQTLQQINSALNTYKPVIPMFVNKDELRMKKQIAYLYGKKLNALMLPRIKYLLFRNLRRKSLPPEELYRNLKIYLELGAADKFDKNYLVKSLATILTADSKNAAQHKLLPHLNDFLENYSHTLKINRFLVAMARNKLNKLGSTDLAFAILANEVPDNQPLSLNFSANERAAFVFTFADDNIDIPSIYTAKNFALIYPQLIDKAAKQTIQGNWVIGQPTSKHNNINLDDLTRSLTNKYLQQYADTWTQFIENIKMVNFTKLNNLITATKLLSNNNSPLLELTQLIQDNIVPQVAAISQILKNFSTLTDNILKPHSSQSMMMALKDLYLYLQPINESHNSAKQNFEITSIRMRNNGEQQDPIEHLLTVTQNYPEPIKSWLYNLGTNAWHLMLLSAEDYINTAWEKNIIPQYEAQIANHFPFANVENNEVTLANFTYFFAPHGLIDKFFKDYLEPFVDSSELPWKLKNLDGDELPIYLSTLAALQKAWQIQQRYFRRNDQSLYVPFSIQPLAIKDTTASFTISLGEQEKTYRLGELYKADQFVWPDSNNSNIAKIIFTDRYNNHAALNKHGPWAWFKLLRQATMKSNKNHYNFMFERKNLALKFDLITSQGYNPFSLTLLQQFKLPDNL